MPRDAPDGWHWGIGNRSTSYFVARNNEQRLMCSVEPNTNYTYWLYTDDVEGYECQVWWDKGSDHTVHFYECHGYDDEGDTIIDEYPTERGSFESEEEAVKWALQKANELQ